MSVKQLNHNEKLTLTVRILKRGKDLASDRFPKPNPTVAQVWTDAMGRVFDIFPFPEMWDDAVDYWSVEMVTDRMATPRDIKDAVYEVKLRWNRDPQRSAVLQQHRDALYERNTGLPSETRALNGGDR